MNLKVIKNDKAVIIEIDGRLDTTNFSKLENEIMKHLENGKTDYVIDCSNMDYVSSSGLRVFLMALKKVKALEGKFLLCGMQESIREIFEISGFTTIFDIYKNQEEALNTVG